jgi:alpha-L-rhamnosidase
VYGEIKLKWEIQDGNTMILRLNVPVNSLAVISLVNIDPGCIQELNDYVTEMEYSNYHYDEKERRVEFTAPSGKINIEYKLNDFCKINA